MIIDYVQIYFYNFLKLKNKIPIFSLAACAVPNGNTTFPFNLHVLNMTPMFIASLFLDKADSELSFLLRITSIHALQIISLGFSIGSIANPTLSRQSRKHIFSKEKVKS
jgi:hypothetical protein